jgi:hypothetical protein
MTTPWAVAFVVLVIVVFALAVVTLGLLRRVIPLLEQTGGAGASASFELGALPLLARVADLHLVRSGGGQVAFPAGIAETTIVLLVEAGCAPCATLAGVLRRDRRLSDGLPITVICDREAPAAFRLPEWITVLIGERSEITAAFGTSATPYGFVLGAGGIVLERGVVNDRSDLVQMTRNQRGGAPQQDAAAVV